MAKDEPWSQLGRRNQRLLKQRTCLSNIMQNRTFVSDLLVQPYIVGHNNSYISNILKMLVQANVTITLTLC